eukprot:gene8255-1475_t
MYDAFRADFPLAFGTGACPPTIFGDPRSPMRKTGTRVLEGKLGPNAMYSLCQSALSLPAHYPYDAAGLVQARATHQQLVQAIASMQ